ncbi:ribbon-helix-helix domain-containing protein [Roseivivax sp. CAU 1761]
MSQPPHDDIPAAIAAGRPVKRSLTLRGHRTSVSLEDAFWQAFREIARERGVAVNLLAARIDAARGLETGLATAIRLFVLDHYRRGAGRGDAAR